MTKEAPRLIRKVKIDGKWLFAKVAMKNGRPDLSRVVYKGKTFRPRKGHSSSTSGRKSLIQ